MEVYRRESFGVVVGTQRGKTFTVKYCLPYQSAERGYRTITVARTRQDRVDNALQCLSPDNVIGDFHSHTGDVIDYLSGADVEDLFRMKKDFISVLVCLNKTKKYKKWSIMDDICISGTLGTFLIDIKAFHYHHKKKSLARMDINCGYVDKVNQLFCKINKTQVKNSTTKPTRLQKKPAKKPF